VSWSKRFDEPIELPDGTKLVTLRQALEYLVKTIPEAEHSHPKVEAAAFCITHAAESGLPVMFARIGTLKAINRHVERVFNRDRKDPHWGRRKLKRDS
jgi:hypothetical protein